MTLLFDFLPLLAFFVAFKLSDIFVATGVLIVAVIIQAAVQWIKHRKLSPMMLTSALLVLLFGGITLIFRNEAFIQWKPTIAYWLFAVGFLATGFFSEKTVVEQMLGEQITLSRALWHRLNLVWVLFFILLGAINLWLLHKFELAAWVSWHTVALMGLTFVFILLQGVWLATKMPPESAADTPQSADVKSDNDRT